MPYEKGNGKTVVIALGGNALGNTPQEQLTLVRNTAKHIVDMIEDGTNVVVSHGNGPPGRHDQQRLRLRGGQRRQDPGHALPRGRRHVPGLHHKRRRGVRFLVGEGFRPSLLVPYDGRPPSAGRLKPPLRRALTMAPPCGPVERAVRFKR